MGKEPEEFDLEQMEQETEDMLRLRYITKENAKFQRTEGGFVSLSMEGEEYARVQIYRTFPFTDPDCFLSIRESNEKAKEIAVVKNLKTDVAPETAKMLREQMNIRYFTPIVEKIIDIKDEYGFAYFHVLTNQGVCRFTIHMGGGAVVNLTDTRLLISDLDGNRFEIPDIRELSQGELKKLDLFL